MTPSFTPLSLTAAALLALASAGCDGLLGLGGKTFDDTTSSSGTGGSGGTGGVTGSTGTGATGECGGDVFSTQVTDDFEFSLCGKGTTDVLMERGWHFTRQEEQYPEGAPFHATLVQDGKFYSSTAETLYWFIGKKGLLAYKEVTGDFLVVTQTAISTAKSPTLPTDRQAGAGLMARDPASAAHESGDQRWIAVDRGIKLDDVSMEHETKVFGSWQLPNAANDAFSIPYEPPPGDPADTPTGLVALCRVGSVFHLWATDPDGTWQDRSDLLSGAPMADMPSTLQVGLFVYAYNDGPDSPDGVKASFDFVQQIAPNGDCDPEMHGF